MGTRLANVDGGAVWDVSGGALWRALRTFSRSVKGLRLPVDTGDDHPGDGMHPVGVMRRPPKRLCSARTPRPPGRVHGNSPPGHLGRPRRGHLRPPGGDLRFLTDNGGGSDAPISDQGLRKLLTEFVAEGLRLVVLSACSTQGLAQPLARAVPASSAPAAPSPTPPTCTGPPPRRARIPHAPRPGHRQAPRQWPVLAAARKAAARWPGSPALACKSRLTCAKAPLCAPTGRADGLIV